LASSHLLEPPCNSRHPPLLRPTYVAGVRVGEVVRLQRQDLDRARRFLRVRQGEGRKDRYGMFSDTAVLGVEKYWARVAGEAQCLFLG
jgi:site-specific recombinase XerD